MSAYGLWSLVLINSAILIIVIMFGFLLQWPTLLTLVMFPALVWMYVHLAHKEERDALNEFGEQYARYTEITPAFVPRLRGRRQDVESH
jgi:protein-S-isoprenylcysteine O-methyltransferase Ste14